MGRSRGGHPSLTCTRHGESLPGCLDGKSRLCSLEGTRCWGCLSFLSKTGRRVSLLTERLKAAPSQGTRMENSKRQWQCSALLPGSPAVIQPCCDTAWCQRGVGFARRMGTGLSPSPPGESQAVQCQDSPFPSGALI